MDSKLKVLLDNLKKYDILIKYIDEDNLIIHTEGFVISITEDSRELLISFNIQMIPEDVAIIILILKEIRMFSSKIKVAQSFYVDTNGICRYGNIAMEVFEEEKKKKIIEKYLRDKLHETILSNDKNCFHC